MLVFIALDVMLCRTVCINGRHAVQDTVLLDVMLYRTVCINGRHAVQDSVY